MPKEAYPEIDFQSMQPCMSIEDVIRVPHDVLIDQHIFFAPANLKRSRAGCLRRRSPASAMASAPTSTSHQLLAHDTGIPWPYHTQSYQLTTITLAPQFCNHQATFMNGDILVTAEKLSERRAALLTAIMNDLLDFMVTWSDGKLVPLSSLPSIGSIKHKVPQWGQDKHAVSGRETEPDLLRSSQIQGLSSSGSPVVLVRPMIAPKSQRRRLGDGCRLSTHGKDEVQEKSLKLRIKKQNTCQDDMAQAPSNNSSVGHHQPDANIIQSPYLWRSIDSSYSLQPTSGILLPSEQGILTWGTPTSLAQMDALPPPHIEGLDMMSMDDFEKAHPFTPPPAKMINLTSSPSDGAHADSFHMKCQAKGLTPFFTYVEPSKGCFLATAHIDNQPLEQVGPYASKRAAKDAACKAALAKLEAFPDKRQLKRTEMRSSQPVTRSLQHNSGEHGSKMNMICQQKSLVPNITYTEPSKGCFTAALTIDGQLIDEVGLFANKKDAKEELCKVSYPKLLELDSRKKRKSMDPSGELPDAPEILVEENWVGTLVEHCQHSKIAYPIYNESGPHPSHGPFSCAVHFAGSPPSGFGAAAGPFKKKSDAKKNAAMEAVLWLRHQGQLAVGSTKRRKSSTLGDGENDPSANSTGLSQSFPDAMDITDEGPTQSGSIGKQVQDLCLRLGFTNPTFELATLSGSFYNMHATFAPQDVRYEPRLAGPMAPVYNVHGKKTAKNECWAELWKVLEEIRLSRAG